MKQKGTAFTHEAGDCIMKRILRLVMLVTVPLLTAAIWMDDQQSYKPYKAPVLAPPADAVPVTGRELASRDAEFMNPVAPTAASVSQGKALFDTNCAMCHGTAPAERGLVGKKLIPPPPGLEHDLVRSRSDSHIFKAITFGFGRMPAFKDKLMPEERWSLVNFLRTRK
jgi:mono/diheme cytochrome c family protein